MCKVFEKQNCADLRYCFYSTVAGFSLKIEVGGRNKKVEGGSEGLAYS